MDIAGMWRSMRADPADAPRPGAHQETAGPGITISVTQQCQVALPLAGLTPDEVTVTVTSHRPGVGAQVAIAANFNSPDGSYQGPTTKLGIDLNGTTIHAVVPSTILYQPVSDSTPHSFTPNTRLVDAHCAAVNHSYPPNPVI